MHGRINDVEVLLTVDDVLVNHSRMYGCHIVVVHFATYNLDKVLVRLELHVLNSHLVHFLDNACIVRSQHLCAVAPVSLISVVFLRVV